MDLKLNTESGAMYQSKSQQARCMTEHWVADNLYCLKCGEDTLSSFKNNRPVADFYCARCKEEFELKSKCGEVPNVIVNGAYHTMMQRLAAENNPHLLFLSYTRDLWVKDMLMVPKYFFTAELIQQRKPLSATARRAGWIGCNINIGKVAKMGKIYLVKDQQVRPKDAVLQQFKTTDFLENQQTQARGWLLDVMYCLDQIDSKSFSLQSLYDFEPLLKAKYPNNHFIKDKIRQQLQRLRDHGIIEFVARGHYRKLV